MTDTKTRKQWAHREGDRYAVIVGRIVGGPERGYMTQHTLVQPPYEHLAGAKAAGFRLGESDDFNIGVWRGGRLVAMLWMREVVDDDPRLMNEIAANMGIQQ